LLLLNYFAADLDKWDPKLTNGFAAERDVILFDYPGIGGSSGETPPTVAALTKDGDSVVPDQDSIKSSVA
jgi:pimeloyl-ACP methyl ester carboxylesterase